MSRYSIRRQERFHSSGYSLRFRRNVSLNNNINVVEHLNGRLDELLNIIRGPDNNMTALPNTTSRSGLSKEKISKNLHVQGAKCVDICAICLVEYEENKMT